MSPWRWMFRAKVKVLRLRPGDVVVLETPATTTMGELHAVKEAWGAELPDIPVAVLGGLKLAGVVRPDSTDDDEGAK